MSLVRICLIPSMATAVLRRFALARPRLPTASSHVIHYRRVPMFAVHRVHANPFAVGSSNVFGALYSTDNSDGSNGKDTEKSQDEANDADSDNVEVVIKNDLVTVGEGDNAPTYPHVLVMPALRRPFFPGVVLPMTISNPETTRALMALKESGQKYVGVFLKKSNGDPLKSGGGEDEIKNLSEIHHVGSFARIDNMLPFDANSVQVLMVSQRRIAIDSLRDEGPPIRVNISNLDSPPFDPKSKLIRAYSNEIVATLREIVKMNPLFKDHMQYFSQRVDVHNPYKLADFAASVTSADGEELQFIMEEMSCEARLKKALELITKELELSKVQQTIKEQVEEKVSKNQRNFLLMEQLKAIKKELGMEKDDKEAMIVKYRERLAEFASGSIPASVNEIIEDELNKMSMLEKNSSEYNVTRNYLDWLTQLPWGKSTEENFDLAKAKQILDEDHYGLKDIKERILEFIAVSKLKGNVQGKIVCFVGPPGVGKTSIGKSIARSLNREFYRFSVGGLSDVAEIKGHRRTYVGAMPGKIIQCLKSTQSSNPLILIDEIDKLGRGYQGDPASALLELLDPSQNSGFVDHYMDVPVDLSRVLFICTANVTDTIPGPLLDRMEVLRLSGYDSPEKLAIAKDYLVPKILERTGLGEHETTPKSLGLTDEAILTLVKQYCRESGVRNLEKHVEKIFRKVALEVVEDLERAKHQETGEVTGTENAKDVFDDEARFLVSSEKLSKYVGKPIFTSDRMFDKQFPGVVMGLAWTAMGGASLYIETTKVHTKGDRSGLITTGQMGSVMEESTKIAHTFARSKLHEIDPESKFFEENEVHLHVPEGATPKDGPSAGCTMVTALLSLAMDKTVKRDLAMTGELSLIGKVLPVGGIKEKTIAAKRSGVKTLILPLGNKHDFEDLEDYLRNDLDVHFADYYDDVYNVAFEQE
ncbi:putative ribosomal protein S5 domain 2-type [Plasmopara halstedii]